MSEGYNRKATVISAGFSSVTGQDPGWESGAQRVFSRSNSSTAELNVLDFVDTMK